MRQKTPLDQAESKRSIDLSKDGSSRHSDSKRTLDSSKQGDGKKSHEVNKHVDPKRHSEASKHGDIKRPSEGGEQSDNKRSKQSSGKRTTALNKNTDAARGSDTVSDVEPGKIGSEAKSVRNEVSIPEHKEDSSDIKKADDRHKHLKTCDRECTSEAKSDRSESNVRESKQTGLKALRVPNVT